MGSNLGGGTLAEKREARETTGYEPFDQSRAVKRRAGSGGWLGWESASVGRERVRSLAEGAREGYIYICRERERAGYIYIYIKRERERESCQLELIKYELIKY